MYNRSAKPITPSPTVEAVYDCIESLPDGAPLLIASDFDPGAKAELEPMERALLHHCFRKKLRVIGMTFWFRGDDLAHRIFQEIAGEYGLQSGRDYVYLGYKPGAMSQVITNMGENLLTAFPQDKQGNTTANTSLIT